MRKNRPVGDGGEKIAERVAFLQQAGKNAAPFCGHRFERERCAHAPFAAHADAVEQPQNQKDGEIWREAGEHFDGGIKKNVEHERKAAAIAIGEQAEEKCADGTRGQAGGDGQRDISDAEMKFLGDGREDEGEDEEIEGVERPAEKTGEQGVALIRALFGGSWAHADGGVERAAGRYFDPLPRRYASSLLSQSARGGTNTSSSMVSSSAQASCGMFGGMHRPSPGAQLDFAAVNAEFHAAFQAISELLVEMMMHRDVRAFFQNDARQHDGFADHHLAVEKRIEMLEFHFFPFEMLE